MPVGIILQVDFHPGNLPKVVELAKDVVAHAKSDAEPGCLTYFFFRGIDNPDVQYGIEQYVSQEAIEVDHMNSKAFEEFIAADAKAGLRLPGPPNFATGERVVGFLTRSSGGRTASAPKGESIVIVDIFPKGATPDDLVKTLSGLASEAEKNSSVLSYWAVLAEKNPVTGEDVHGKTQIFSRFPSKVEAEAFWASNHLQQVKNLGAEITAPKYCTRVSGFLAKDEPEVEV